MILKRAVSLIPNGAMSRAIFKLQLSCWKSKQFFQTCIKQQNQKKYVYCYFNQEWLKYNSTNLTCSFTEEDIDILILPEMAFSGYVFKSKEEIMPFLEDAENGPSALWAKHQAKRLKSYVCVGYPQKKDDTHFYNSMCVINPKGELMTTYQKAFLYETDENWAEEGPGFRTLQMEHIGKVGLGICMDINPYRFEANFRDFEFANYHLKENTNLILCSMSWLKSDSNPDSTIKYWATRMLPLYQDSEDGRHTIFVACNRTGSERQSTFAGSSCVLDISNESITILNRLGSEDIGIMTVDI